MSLCVELNLEEAVDMSQNRLRDVDDDGDEDDDVHNTKNI